ncbi:MAG: hypothetical protein M1821_006829 [Bathelium mastoideum]|nr:MAG: hypothetical protein M1821_006829 [Bathelium mastoideum]
MASLDNDKHSTSSTSTENSEVDAEDGWEDTEEDSEDIQIINLFDDATFRSVDRMLQHCKDKHDFDFLRIARDFDLDFYGMVKLVNFVRSKVKDGIADLKITSKETFGSDQYLQPVLPDDALLFCLDEVQIREPNEDHIATTENENSITNDPTTKIQSLEAELSKLRSQFTDYRLAVAQTLDERWNAPSTTTSHHPTSSSAPLPSLPESSHPQTTSTTTTNDNEASYFASYALPTMHQTMLQDTIRTDAYRDFIYANKPLFTGRTVLDLGSGTGILSLFCARAGAARVLAVDNASGDMVERARAIVHANSAGNVVNYLRGRVEEVVLPVEGVDVLVSEWMGYGLLYEAMLDAVLWARDRYLRPGGLMVPAACTLRVAPVADPDWVAANVSFWRDVYGFDMQPMMRGVYDEVVVRRVEPAQVVGRSAAFKVLDLGKVRKEDLVFVEGFETELDRDVDALDGWVIWFDTFFLTSPETVVSVEERAEEWGSKSDGSNAFTTGPYGKDTHWQSAFLTIDHEKRPGQPLKKGQRITGSVEYRRRTDNERALDIIITWNAVGTSEKGSQCFILK